MAGSERRPRLSWFPFYPDAWVGGTSTLRPAERGAYLGALCAQWASKDLCAIPDDPKRLRLICGGVFTQALREKFDSIEIGGGLYLRNRRLADEWARARKEYEGKAAAGGDRERPAERPTERGHIKQRTEYNVEHNEQHPTGRPFGVPANPFVPDRAAREALEREALKLTGEIVALTGEDGAAIFAEAAHYDGATRQKYNPANMTDERLLATVQDLRGNLKAAQAKKARLA